MISKLRFSLIAIVMLVLLGFGFQNQAKGQVGLDGLFCPAVPNTTGWLETEIVGSSPITPVPDFSGGLLGTVENSGADAVGGLDWQHVDNTFSNNLPSGAIGSITPTNATGSQLVTWWTQKDGRNTYLQVTNSDIEGDAGVDDIHVHVRIHNEACAEIRDFCDVYTPGDTHEYNLGDLVANNGAIIPDNNLQGVEGWLVVTAVAPGTCASPDEQAYDHNYLAGQLIIHDSDDYLYGVNTYARQAICEDVDSVIEVNRVPEGFFESGALGVWTQALGGVVDVIDPFTELNPFQAAPLSGFVISTSPGPQGGSGSTYNGGPLFTNLDDTNYISIGGAADSNVAILQSGNIAVQPGDSSSLSYAIQLYDGQFAFGNGCSNWAAVTLIRDNGGGNGTIVDSNCYQTNSDEVVQGSVPGGGNCVILEATNPTTFGIHEFFQGRSSVLVNQTLNGATPGNYRVQVITGMNGGAQNAGTCAPDNDPPRIVGALASAFVLNGEDTVTARCDGKLDGRFNALLDRVDPNVLAGQFNILPGNVQAGADAVLINFADDYGNGPGNVGFGPYRPVAANSVYFISIFDEDEQDVSCGDLNVCFTRLGIDDALIPSDQFNPATPTPTPTVPPTITPTPTVPPTLAPTPTPNNGGSSSCAIAGSPVQLGTALANVLIPLVPVAFAFGVRAVRRRKK